jgi:predicted lysophospholipase L1 biosynthesis ABC-type transport system permease subunit
MSEALRKPASVADALPAVLAELLPPLRPAEINDNETPPARREREARGFEIPAWMWRTMVACYAVFLAALLAATGGGRAAFAIAVSAVYVAMFFGTARAMLRQAPPQPRSPLERAGGVLQTIYGPLNRREVAAQLLVVPGAIAFFGVAVMVIRLTVA